MASTSDRAATDDEVLLPHGVLESTTSVDDDDEHYWESVFREQMGGRPIDVNGTERLSDALTVLMAIDDDDTDAENQLHVHFIGAAAAELSRVPHTLAALRHFVRRPVHVALVGPELDEGAPLCAGVELAACRYDEWRARGGDARPTVAALLHPGLMPATLARDWRATLARLAADAARCVLTSFDAAEHRLACAALRDACVIDRLACRTRFSGRNPYRSLRVEHVDLTSDEDAIAQQRDNSSVVEYAVNQYVIVFDIWKIKSDENKKN